MSSDWNKLSVTILLAFMPPALYHLISNTAKIVLRQVKTSFYLWVMRPKQVGGFAFIWLATCLLLESYACWVVFPRCLPHPTCNTRTPIDISANVKRRKHCILGSDGQLVALVESWSALASGKPATVVYIWGMETGLKHPGFVILLLSTFEWNLILAVCSLNLD